MREIPTALDKLDVHPPAAVGLPYTVRYIEDEIRLSLVLPISVSQAIPSDEWFRHIDIGAGLGG